MRQKDRNEPSPAAGRVGANQIARSYRVVGLPNLAALVIAPELPIGWTLLLAQSPGRRHHAVRDIILDSRE